MHFCTLITDPDTLQSQEISEKQALLEKVGEGDHPSLIKLFTDHNYEPTTHINTRQETLLHLACRKGYFDIVRALIEVYHCSLNVKDKFGNSPFHTACANQQLKIVAYFCRHIDHIPCAHINNDGDTVLHVACAVGSVRMVRLILCELFLLHSDMGVYGMSLKFRTYMYQEDIFPFLVYMNSYRLLPCRFDIINLFNFDGYSPVQIACCNGRLDIIQFFFTEVRPWFNIPAFVQCVPSLLNIACRYKHRDIIGYLYTMCDINTPLGVQVQQPTSSIVSDSFVAHYTPSVLQLRTIESSLFFAVKRADKVLFKFLTTSYVWDRSSLNSNEDTLLHAACVSCDIEMVKMVHSFLGNLAENEDYRGKKNKQGNTCLHLACEWGSLEIVKYLIDVLGLNINERNHDEETPLHLSIRFERLSIFDFLIDEHADVDVNASNKLGETPLHLASFNPSLHFAKKIVSKPSFNSIDNPDIYGDTPLFNACRTQKKAMISFLMEHKCNLLHVNNFGETILHVVLRLEMLDLADDVFSKIKSYPPKLQNYFGQTLLHTACNTGDLKMVRYLDHHKKVYSLSEDINLFDKINELTPLQCACIWGNKPLCKYLLEVPDCDPDTKNKDGDTVLHICCRNNLSEVANLCKARSSTLVRNEAGDTPLHVACKHERCDLLLLLLEGTDAKKLEGFCNADGDSVLHIAAGKDIALKVVKKLVDGNICDLAAKNLHTGNTALHVAFSKGALKNAEYLFDKQACEEDSWYNDDKESPLCLAVRNKHYEFLKAILNLKQPELSWFLQNCITVRRPFDNVLKEEYISMPLPHYLIYSVIEAHKYDPRATLFERRPHYKGERGDELNSCELVSKFLGFLLDHDSLFGDLHTLRDSHGCGLLHYLVLCKCEHLEKNEDKILVNNLCNIPDKYKQTPLHLACLMANERMIYNMLQLESMCLLLSDKNEFGETPSNLYNKSSTACTNFLLACGAEMEFKEESRHYAYSTKDTKTSNIGVIVVGNSAVGKTTLLHSLKKMLTDNRTLKHEKNPTTGIVTNEIKSFKNDSNSYTFYDFAGQIEFETSHSVRLENILSSASESSTPSPFVFFLVVKGSDSLSENKLQIMKWFSFVRSHVKVNNKNIHVALVCSHNDLFQDDAQRKERKDTLKVHLKLLHETPVKINIHETPVLLNCKKTDTAPLNKLLRYLEEMFLSCKPTSLNAVCQELSSLLKSWSHDKPCQVHDLVDKIRNGRKFSLKDNKIHVSSSHYSRLLPNESNKLIELLKELSIKKQIVLLMQSEEKLNWWIISKYIQDTMFSKVSSIFSPETFEDGPNHLPITNNTGVVPTEKLSSIFSKLPFPIDLIESYLISMEYCKLIEDKEVLHLIAGSESTDGSNRYFFFPALIKKSKQELPQSKSMYNYGWAYEKHTDLGLRFLHSLLLSLTFKFPSNDTDSGSKFERRLVLWINGLFWCTTQGIDVLVEVIEGRKVVALFRCNSKKQLMPLAKYRSDVIAEIEKVLKRCTPDKASTGLENFILHPSPSNFNADLSTELLHSKIALMKIHKCVSSKEPDSRSLFISNTETVSLCEVCGYDSYMLLKLSTLMDLQKQLETALSPQTFLEVRSQLGAEDLACILEIRISENMLEEFIEKHGDESALTLCSHLNNYSLFQLQDLSF